MSHSNPPPRATQEHPVRPIRTLGMCMAGRYFLNINSVDIAEFASEQDAEMAFGKLRECVVKDHRATTAFEQPEHDAQSSFRATEYPNTIALLMALRGLCVGKPDQSNEFDGTFLPKPIAWGKLYELTTEEKVAPRKRDQRPFR